MEKICSYESQRYRNDLKHKYAIIGVYVKSCRCEISSLKEPKNYVIVLHTVWAKSSYRVIFFFRYSYCE